MSRLENGENNKNQYSKKQKRIKIFFFKKVADMACFYVGNSITCVLSSHIDSLH